jgi:hypothetical protein
MTENFIIIVFNDRVFRNFDSYFIECFCTVFMFLKKLMKFFLKKIVKFSTNGFLVQTKQNQTERLSQKPGPNQNQMICWIWNQI